jgi:hypothetical protein
MAKTNNNWKTKKTTRENGSASISMICQNSKRSLSKYSDFAPEDGNSDCKEWTEVTEQTNAVLCPSCTMRSVNF